MSKDLIIMKQATIYCLQFPSYFILLFNLISKAVLWEKEYYPIYQIGQIRFRKDIFLRLKGQPDAQTRFETQNCLTLKLYDTLSIPFLAALHCHGGLDWLTLWRVLEKRGRPCHSTDSFENLLKSLDTLLMKSIMAYNTFVSISEGHRSPWRTSEHLFF